MLLKLMTALVLMTAPARAVEPPALQGLGALVDEHVAATMAEEKIPGVAVTVVESGKRVVHKGYGWADVERRVPVDPERTRFLIGSETKLFTAQAALQLVRASKLELNADVNTYLKTFKIVTPTRGVRSRCGTCSRTRPGSTRTMSWAAARTCGRWARR
ncbi:serine hydrolase domain-containing protein [Streptosporangium sp. NPDC000396]|uniref:serine hydrolase domain-containing protein n=1 Tax=Streptosporangium sp. NPDC000396 TaxID=3366185 RepID=UPI003680D09E